MRIKLKLSYDGTEYVGFQIQKEKKTIQRELEKSLLKLLKEDIKVVASGRTDSGVHAEGQVCHFDTCDTNIPPKKYADCLNNYLPKDIRVLESVEVSKDFHARFCAKKKTYQYSLYVSNVELPLKERYFERVERIDINKIKEVANLLIGEHNFKAFSKNGSSAQSFVRNIYNIEIENYRDEEIKIIITGNGFLYNMVRIIVGAMLGYSNNKINLEEIKDALASGERKKPFKTVSAKGLTLKNVYYI